MFVLYVSLVLHTFHYSVIMKSRQYYSHFGRMYNSGSERSNHDSRIILIQIAEAKQDRDHIAYILPFGPVLIGDFPLVWKSEFILGFKTMVKKEEKSGSEKEIKWHISRRGCGQSTGAECKRDGNKGQGLMKLPLLIHLRVTQLCPGEGKFDLKPSCLFQSLLCTPVFSLPLYSVAPLITRNGEEEALLPSRFFQLIW